MLKDFRKLNMQQYRDEAPKGSVEYWLRYIEWLGVGNYRVIASNLRYAMRQLRKAMAQDKEPSALIDAELAEVLPFLSHKPGCGEEYFRKRTAPLGVYIEIPCTCGLAALLARFTPGK